jgi:integrase
MPRGRKLGYDEGSVYWDGSVNMWRGAITVGGRRYRVSGLSKTEATNLLGALRLAVNIDKPTDEPTVGQWVAWWLENVGTPEEDSSGATRSNYRWALEQTSPIWGIKISELKAADVNRLLGSLAKRKPSKPTSRGGRRGPLGQSALRRVRFALRVVLDAAVAEERLTVNVAQPELARLPTSARPVRRRRPLTRDEANRLMATARDHRLGALVGVMLWCGLRPGEVTGLTWDCIDFKNETMSIRQSRKIATNGTMTIEDTRAYNRTLRIPNVPTAPVLNLLRVHGQMQETERLAAPAWKYDDLVFANSIGDYIDPSNLRRELARLCNDASIPVVITPNELCHSCTSLLGELGVPDAHIAALLGRRNNPMLDTPSGPQAIDVVDLTEAQGRMLATDT